MAGSAPVFCRKKCYKEVVGGRSPPAFQPRPSLPRTPSAGLRRRPATPGLAKEPIVHSIAWQYLHPLHIALYRLNRIGCLAVSLV